jgi:microcystin-dependent protein
MSTCSNCYNGCTEIVSDRCVKYTGIDVPVLGIQTGDSLSYVEQALITFLTSTLDGEGIKIDLTGVNICTLVQKYLPTCKDLTIVDISKALIKAACDLQEQVDDVVAELAVLNANYTIGCLTGVTASSDTHAIVQAVINKLCQLEIDLDALALDLETNYVSVADINTYIQAYLNSLPGNNLMNKKMVPYTPIPFYPTPAYLSGKFDSMGAGIGDWDKIYLCNGLNGTPDLRGRTLVGATTGMGGGTYNSAVDPNLPGSGNPNYLLGTLVGANQVTLNTTQIPSHTHANTVNSILTDPGHTHQILGSVSTSGGSGNFAVNNVNNNGVAFPTQTSGVNGTGITVSTSISNAAFGGGQPHGNIQPSIGCYFIMYIP